MPAQPELLVIRLRELKDDIAEVQRVVEKAATRHSRLTALKSAADRLAEKLSVARLNASHLQLLAEEEDEIQIRLDERNVSCTELESSLKQALLAVQEIRKTLGEFDRAMIHLEDLNPEEVMTRCTDVNKEIEDIDRKVGTSELSQSEAWAAFDELSNNHCRTLFNDYVDLLSGLTLRDTGLDDRSSELTDELLRELLGVRVLAVPARPADLPGVAGRSSLDSLVRLWFPEWTIWAVPLFGFNAGLAWSRTTSPLARGLLGSADPPYSRRCLVADAYATYALGPAYACAVILLRLRPLAASEPAVPPTDVQRAHVILALLRRLGDTGMFASVTDIVAACWAEAVRQRGGTTEPADWADLDEFAAEAHRTLQSISSFKPFDAELWENVARPLYHVLADTADADTIDGDVSVRGLLNAAWAAHLNKLDDPKKVTEIGRTAMQLWKPQERSGPLAPKRTGGSIQSQRMPGYGAQVQFPHRDDR